MNWIPFVIAIILVVIAVWIVIDAEVYDKKVHVRGKLCSWNHIEEMALRYTAATVVAAIALAIIIISLAS